MEADTRVNVGDRLRMKKKHPCGGDLWEVLRVGADFRLKCLTCGRVVMIPRADALRRAKDLLGGEGA
ncbi:MAG: DUF951 domain-containing protein [Bacillota bacterium]